MYLQYRPANKKRLFGVSLRFFFVGPTPGHFPYLVTYPPKVANRVLFARIFRTSIYWRRLFWIGAPYFECAEVRGAGSRNGDCRRQPPATDYVACSTSDAFIIQRKNSKHKETNPHILCVLHPPSNPHLVCFLFQLGIHVALSCMALSCLSH